MRSVLFDSQLMEVGHGQREFFHFARGQTKSWSRFWVSGRFNRGSGIHSQKHGSCLGSSKSKLVFFQHSPSTEERRFSGKLRNHSRLFLNMLGNRKGSRCGPTRNMSTAGSWIYSTPPPWHQQNNFPADGSFVQAQESTNWQRHNGNGAPQAPYLEIFTLDFSNCECLSFGKGKRKNCSFWGILHNQVRNKKCFFSESISPENHPKKSHQGRIQDFGQGDQQSFDPKICLKLPETG